MSGIYLLDTNAIIARMNDDANVLSTLMEATQVFLPIIAVGELYFGAEKSTKVEENKSKVTDLIELAVVLMCDVKTAEHYGIIKNHLRQKGRPIPENDIWIAAIAMQHGLTLLTRDNHFNEITGLAVKSW